MPTTKPRITVTLTERQHEVLRSLSSSSGQSMSAYIVGFLDMALPTLERMASTMQALANASKADILRVRDQLDEAQRVFEPMAMAVVAQSDMFLGRVEQAAAGGDGDARARTTPPATVPTSPPTNRGVTPTPGKPLNPKPRAASSGVRTRSPKSEKRGVR